jgi:hypothetical protein
MPAIDTLLKWATAMNTAKRAMDNMDYVRRLLEEKQPGFCASVELAVSFYPPSDRVAGGNYGTDAAELSVRSIWRMSTSASRT